MRFNLRENLSLGGGQIRHHDAVTSVAWASAEDLYTSSDDHTVLRWSPTTNDVTAVAELPEDWHPISAAWCPSAGKRQPDVLAIGSDDGEYILQDGKKRDRREEGGGGGGTQH